MIPVNHAQVGGKTVIVRCDFDVAVNKGKISEDIRIRKSAETLKYLLSKKAKLFLISHLGRPSHKEKSLSLKIVLPLLKELLGKEISFQETLEEKVEGEIILLENLRFWPEEEANDEDFAKKIAKFGEVFVFECFSVAHRRHASVSQLGKLLPSFAGLEFFKEVKELERIFKHPQHPLLVIIGGAKIETKLPVIVNVAKVADKVLVGGKLMFEINQHNLPANVEVAKDHIDQKDLGQQSLKEFKKEIEKAAMIVWNGPLGKFEEERYQKGTREIARAVATSKGYSIVGGGDTLSALNKENLLKSVDFVSVGGGAMLEFLSGNKLPALEVLNYYKKNHYD